MNIFIKLMVQIIEKIKPQGQDSAPGGDEPSSEPPTEPSGDEPGTEEPPAPLAEKSKKPYERPSQAGKKKASDYPYGEDRLGKLTLSRTDETDPLRHSYKKDSALNLEGLDAFISTLEADKKSLLAENKTTGSYMDEKNVAD